MSRSIKRISFGLLLMSLCLTTQAKDRLPEITVYKSATCGCCSGWIDHLEENGFKVKFHNVTDLNAYKQKAHLPYGMGSCHTGFVDGYAVEGHVPAEDIKELLREKPEVRGVAVPGMPMGSPGMDFGSQKDRYKTLSYTQDGVVEVFAEH